MLEFCNQHPDEAEYPGIPFKNSTYPIGAYPCCSEKSIKFQPLDQVN